MSVRNRVLGPPVPKMPFGLMELMEGLTRDVLKSNPKNIYEFCTRHMQTLLEVRDGRALKPLLTLDEKIKTAQKKVKQREEQRQRAYDENKQKLSSADIPCCDDSEYSEQKEIKGDAHADKIINITEKQDHVNYAALTTREHDTDNKELPTVGKIPCSNDSEYSEKKEINIGAHAEEIINITEEQNHGNYDASTSELKSETSGKEDDENQDNENKSKQEVFTAIHSDVKENNDLLTKDEPIASDTTKDNETKDASENNPSQDNQSIVITSDTIIANHDNITESLVDEPTIKIESEDCTEEKIILLERNDTNSHNDNVKIIQNNGLETQIEVVTNMINSNNDIICADTKVKEILPPDSNHAENSHFVIDTEQQEKQIDEPSINNSLNDNGTEISVNSGTETNLTEQPQNIDEPKKSKDDKVIHAILASNSAGNASIKTSEPDTVQGDKLDIVQIIEPELAQDEFDKKSEHCMDTESIVESADGNKNNNINSSMDLETAAITIQKVFRSFLFKTKTASYDDPTTVDIALLTEDKEKEDDEVLNIKERRPLGISRMDTVLQTVNEEKSLSLSTDDSSTLSSAATIIQAHVRGFLVRNKLNSNKTISSNSLIDSDAPSIPSLEADSENIKSKTVLNIHIVPEGGHFVSRDESIFTSMDLSLDSSPPSSINLHPLGYDKSERRKQLKREDAIQSVSPPSNNSGKLSEDHDSVKEVLPVENNAKMVTLSDKTSVEADVDKGQEETKVVIETDSNIEHPTTDASADEMDVITPFVEGRTSRESVNSTKLLHSGEFHDVVVPTNVTRSDTSVVRGE